MQKVLVRERAEKVPPEPTNIQDVLKLYGRTKGETLEAKGDLVVDVGEYVRVDSQIQELNKQKDALKNKVCCQMKDFEAVSIGGKRSSHSGSRHPSVLTLKNSNESTWICTSPI